MRMDPRLVPVLARFAEPVEGTTVDLAAVRAAEVASARGMVGTLTQPVPDTIDWRDATTDGHQPVQIRVYTPQAPSEHPRAALVYAHGGAWTTGSPETTHEHAGNLAADADTIVISVDYRLIPEHPFPSGLDDVYEALRWTAANADRLGIDPACIAIGGSSAGGNLAAAVSVKSRDTHGPVIALQLLEAAALSLNPQSSSWDESRRDLSPLATMLEQGINGYIAAGADPGNPYAAPLSAETFDGLPSAVILVGEADSLRSDSIRYAEALGAAGVQVEVHIFPGIVHGTENFVELLPMGREWHRVCVAALRTLKMTDTRQ